MTRNEILMFAREVTRNQPVAVIEEKSIRAERLALCAKWRTANERLRQARIRAEREAAARKLAPVVTAAVKRASEPRETPFPLVNVKLKAKAPRRSGTYTVAQFFRDVAILVCA